MRELRSNSAFSNKLFHGTLSLNMLWLDKIEQAAASLAVSDKLRLAAIWQRFVTLRRLENPAVLAAGYCCRLHGCRSCCLHHNCSCHHFSLFPLLLQVPVFCFYCRHKRCCCRCVRCHGLHCCSFAFKYTMDCRGLPMDEYVG